MTTVGLELTSFIDPSLTWKRVSKGRGTSRRSRKMKLVQEQEKKSPKRVNSLQSSEDSEKSDVMVQGRRIAGNLEHIPIKKRRLFIRSPSPPSQSDNCHGESEGLDGGQCTSDQCTGLNVSLESAPMQINVSNGSRPKNINSDGIIEESSVKSSDEVHGTSDDFSGIAILAAAACSDRLDNSSFDVGKSQSQLGGIPDKQQESFDVASEVKENVADIHSSELLDKDTKHVEDVCVVDLPKENVQISVNKESDVGMSSINSSQKVEQNTSVVFTSVDKVSLDKSLESFDGASKVKESITTIQSPELLGKDIKHVNDGCVVDMPKIVQISVNKESDVDVSSTNASQKVEQNNYVASIDKDSISLNDKTPENSGTSRDCRLHWDLNTMMDEWDDPVEDTGVVSSAQTLEVVPMNIRDSHNLEDVDGGKANESEIPILGNVEGSELKSAEPTENCDNITSQVVEPERVESGAGFTSVSPSICRLESGPNMSYGFVKSILKENSSSNANDIVMETPVRDSDHETKVNEDANIDCPLSLGLVGIKKIASENTNQVAKETHLQVATEIDRGYESHMEDGELRESHFWEDNEGEEVDTEHVDYDSDNRDEIVYHEAGNDSVQLSGEGLVRECEKQSHVSDKSNEGNCSLRFQGCVSTMDSVEATVCTKRDSPTLKTCSRGAITVNQKECRSSIQADSAGKDFENEPSCNARGASASGRDLQFSDGRCADSMRRSRSSNFECMHNSDGQDEARSQQLSVQMGRFGGRSWNPEQKGTVGTSASEDDSERIIRTTGDTSPLRNCRPRIINTSRSGYQFTRRGSPRERDFDYGMGMMKVRDFSPDNNPRNRFGRFNGVSRGGFREGYRRPNVYEPFKSGNGGPIMNRFSKRERSFSPVGGDRFNSKSRSRSRPRPLDFRSEARMGRGRLPYQQSNHTSEHPRERRSPPIRVFNQSQRFDTMGSRPAMRPMRFHDTTTSSRGHDFDEGDEFRRKPILMRNHRRSRSRSRTCSPDFKPDTRVGPIRVAYQPPTDQIGPRRSPVRVFRPEQRYENGGPPVRIRSDECSRPMVRTVRSPDSTQPGRGHDFNNNSSNVKPRTIFERIHPARHYDMQGEIRRFPYDEEGGSTQNFRRNEKYVRGPGDRRPVEFRGPREERGNNVRYNNVNSNKSDRVFYSGPKQQFGEGIRDYGSDEGIPRRVRP